MARAARQLMALLPAILCALWSLLLLPTQSAQAAPAPMPATTAPASAPGFSLGLGLGREDVVAGPHVVTAAFEAGLPITPPQTPDLASDAVAELPAAVEHSVRFPAPPATPSAPAVDLSVPARGVLAGDPRRERAPPGDRHEPRDPRGPPSPRHS
ncbi:hypothetical protein ACWGQ4_23110 [Streptomyces sp. NPDC055721]|uniref:hypothetical protein n=1 Tax=Streptomyces sp. NPDC127132 TaxID=3345374 RepID=UPI0036363717